MRRALCGLASWPLLGACSMYPKDNSRLDLTSPINLPYVKIYPGYAKFGAFLGVDFR